MTEQPQKYMMFRDREDLCYGRCSSISVLAGQRTAILVNDFNFSGSLYYTVGSVSRNTAIITWFKSEYYSTGKCPSVALLTHQDNTYAIEVHSTNALSMECRYYILSINRETNIVSVGTGMRLERGVYPKVCVVNNDHIIVVYSASSLGSTIYFAVRKLVPSGLGIDWKTRRGEFPERGTDVSIASSRDKIIVVYRHGISSKTISSRVGILNTQTFEINWGEVCKLVPKQHHLHGGVYPSVGLNCHNNIMVSYQSFFSRSLAFVYGEINDTSIQWFYDTKEVEGASGEYPSIAFSDEGRIYDFHKVVFGNTLYLRIGSVVNQRITNAENARPPEQHNEDPLQPTGQV